MESADLAPATKTTYEHGENPLRGGMMEIPYVKPDGVLSSEGADGKQLLGSPSPGNTAHHREKGIALPDSRMWEQGNYTALLKHHEKAPCLCLQHLHMLEYGHRDYR